MSKIPTRIKMLKALAEGKPEKIPQLAGSVMRELVDSLINTIGLYPASDNPFVLAALEVLADGYRQGMNQAELELVQTLKRGSIVMITPIKRTPGKDINLKDED